jgi:UDPglucose--hexose-1-phosphate uridylyltransferase
MNTSPFQGKWEQRWHPIRREWVVYSAHRNTRPWDGRREAPSKPSPLYDPSCYLCPGNKRVHGDVNPDYKDVFIFDNDHPVVGQDAPEVPDEKGFYQRTRADGVARVICYDPRHNVNLPDIPLNKAVKVFQAWRSQVLELSQNPLIQYTLFFENKGTIVGTSNLHPHCQMYATNFVFRHVEYEMEAVQDHRQKHGNNLFEQIIESERTEGRRILAENDHAVAFLPFFARWAYEAWIFPKKRHATLSTMTDKELEGLCSVFQEVTRRYDMLYNMSFPYVMNLYQSPLQGGPYPDYHLHIVLLPPLRQPGLQKFLGGPEINGGNFMADTMPEEKATELRALDVSKFKQVE